MPNLQVRKQQQTQDHQDSDKPISITKDGSDLMAYKNRNLIQAVHQRLAEYAVSQGKHVVTKEDVDKIYTLAIINMKGMGVTND